MTAGAGASASPRWPLVPLPVLGVFFVLPVAGMLAARLLARRRASTSAACSRCWPGRGCTGCCGSRSGRPPLATALPVLLGLPAAYALHRLALPGRGVLRALLLVPFVLPTVVVGVAFRQLLGESGPLGVPRPRRHAGRDRRRPGLLQRRGGGPHGRRRVGVARPAAGRGRRGARRDARRRCSARSPCRRCGPAIVSAASVVFLFCATAFGVVLTLGGLRYSTVETEIYLLTTQLLDLQAAAALSVLQLVVVIGAAGRCAGRLRAVPGPDRRARRRGRGRARPRRGDLPALAVDRARCWCSWRRRSLTLVLGSLRVGRRAGASATTAALDHHRRRQQALLVPVTDALVNSLRTAVDATWMALLLGLLVAVVVTRRSHGRGERRVRGALDGFFMLPLGVSAVTLGFGFLITLDQPPLDLRDSAAAGADRPGAGGAAAGRAHAGRRCCRRRRPAAPGRRLARRRPAAGAAHRRPAGGLAAAAGRDRLRVRGLARRVRRDVVPGPRRAARRCRS